MPQCNHFLVSATTETTCKPPFVRTDCAFQCVSKCEDVTFKTKCPAIQQKNCKPGCVCPSGLYMQDGTCKKIEECKCKWNVNILGERPVDKKKYYEPGELVVYSDCYELWVRSACPTSTSTLQRGLLLCSKCEGSEWIRKDKKCHRKCEWTSWTYGPCNASCDEAYRTAERKRIYTPSLKEEECTGTDTKTEKCDNLACCNPEKERINDKRCDIRCKDVLNPPENPPPNFYLSTSCQNACKCKEGFALTDDGKSCVRQETCGKCKINGTEFDVSWPPLSCFSIDEGRWNLSTAKNYKYIDGLFKAEVLTPTVFLFRTANPSLVVARSTGVKKVN